VPLAPGTRLGPYEITAQIGAGGMGEVYQATDTNLARRVAIKVLPDALALDPERLARFDREAKTLAALSHPNIAGVHGLEKSGGTIALVMELVEGPTLADRIVEGPLPVDDALAIARQIAEALEAAHEQGIVHRDLKPSNVKVRPDGTVKVLDFGLAKAVETSPASGLTQSPTITTPAMTQAGLILGTAAYMSPEQARGKTVDRRSDIWAFGCVLYEMLTGRRAFGGDEVSDVFASVLAREPAFGAVPETAPERVRQVLKACLQKDPKQRMHDIADVRLALAGAFESVVSPAGAPTAPAAAAPLWRRVFPLGVTVLAVGAAAGAIGWLVALPGPSPVVTWSHVLPEGRLFRNAGRPVLTVAPDGESFVYNATGALYLRTMGTLEDSPIPGTEVGLTNPFFSADGRSIGFFDSGQLRRIPVTGGASTPLAPATNPLGASWGPDGMILYAQPDGIWEVSAQGGEPRHLIETGQGEQAHGPQRLPGEDWILFTLATTSEATRWDSAAIVVASPASGERRVIRAGGSDVRYLPTGHLVYAFEDVLYAVPFDVGRLEERGGPVPVVEGVRRAAITGAAFYAVSAGGTLVYAAGTEAEARRRLVWVDRDGRETAVATPPRAYQYPRISPDGTRVALDVRDEQNDIWIWSLARETLTRLTFEAGLDRTPVWSPDGARIAYMSGDNSQGALQWRAADGTGTAELLFTGTGTWFPTSFDPEGERIVVLQRDVGDSAQDVTMLAVAGDREMVPLVQTSFDELNGEVSPDGRWLAYQSDESGQMEVYVRSFPDVDAGGRWQVSPDGGTRPVWRGDGRELFYLDPPGRIMAVEVETGDAFSFGNAVELFNGPYVAANVLRTYDVTDDGERFLMIALAEDQGDGGAEARQIVVVENWLAELERLAPTR